MTSINPLIHQFEIGPMQNYVYFIANPENQESFVVDPAWDVEFIEQEAQKLNLDLKGILITHGHPDHTNGIEALLKIHDIPVYVSCHEASFYKPITENIVEVEAGQELELGNLKVKLLHSPGHTPGSQCFFVKSNKTKFQADENIFLETENILISGDTLFLDGCGRCDLPGGDVEILFDTLANVLCKLPNDTVIFPGHNYHHLKCDCLEKQKQTNPYLRFDNLQSFIKKRLPR